MVIRQRRARMIPMLVLAGVLMSVAGGATVGLLLGRGLHAPLPLWGIVLLLDGLLGYISFTALGLLLHPASLALGPQGLSLEQAGKTRTWDWSDVSDFRVGLHANGIRFEAAGAGGAGAVQMLPGFWPGGPGRIAAWLNAAQRQYTNPSFRGDDWSTVAPPPSHPVRTFVLAFVGCLTAIMVWVQIVMTVHHHPWPLPLG